jgi:hypothetical protein
MELYVVAAVVAVVVAAVVVAAVDVVAVLFCFCCQGKNNFYHKKLQFVCSYSLVLFFAILSVDHNIFKNLNVL